MRECWINVYLNNGRHIIGAPWLSLKKAMYVADEDIIYRIHVRLK